MPNAEQQKHPHKVAVSPWEVRPVTRYGLKHYMVVAPAVRNGLGGDLVLHESGNLANAHLIAAAPELYEALKTAAAMLASRDPECWRKAPECKRILQAIAKAEQ